jgi:hypothetical protein
MKMDGVVVGHNWGSVIDHRAGGLSFAADLRCFDKRGARWSGTTGGA